MLRNRLALLFVFVVVDLLGYSLILPLLPYYAATYGATPFLVGLLATSNALTQTIGAPIIGRLSDRHGRRPLILFSLVGTLASFLVLGFARSLAVILLSRIMDGFLGGSLSLAQAYISDVTDEENRARSLGILGAAFGIGFIIGPAAGGLLSRWSYALPAFVAAGISAVNLMWVYFALPESLGPEQRALLAHNPRTEMSVKLLWKALQRPRLGPLLHVRLFYSLAFTVFTATFALYAKERLALEAEGTGYVLAYVGLLAVLVQGLAMGWLTSRFSEKQLIFQGTVVLAVAFLIWSFVSTVPLLLVILLPIALSAGVLNTILNSATTKAVYKEEVGGALGLSAGLQSATGIVAPALGGLLLQSLGAWALGVFGAGVMGWLVWFTWQRIARQPDEPPAAPLAEAVGEGQQ